MKRSVIALLMCVGLLLPAAAFAQATGTIVYSSIPTPQPPNVPSLGYQANQTLEFGDEVLLEASTPRTAGYATVLMSSWSLHSNYPEMPAAGYTHSITLNIYENSTDALTHTPARTITQDFVIPWRPEADPTCPNGTAWRAGDGQCYNGFAFTITFDLRASAYSLPDQFIFGIAYNTNTWGYSPIGAPGPYESLNVGLNTTPPVEVGTDVDPDGLYWNTMTLGNYTDPSGGVGTFRFDSNWTPYSPAVQFTTFALPTTAGDCKNGAWKNLVRRDFTSFKNQGACVSYVKTGK